MKFGPVAADAAEGALLAHSQRTGTGVIRKGTRLTADHIASLRAAGIDAVIAARPEPGDLHEDEAARKIAEAAVGPETYVERADTGRANLFADRAGLVMVDRAAVDALNAIDPAITLATLTPFTRVSEGRMIGTVKIIPFAASAQSVAAGAVTVGGALSVAPWVVRRVSAISTELSALKASVIDKTLGVFAQRLAAPGADIVEDVRVPHDEASLAEALRAATGEVIVVFGASAVVDVNDVIPAAIRAAGGRVVHLGMPVDPGNLLVLGELDGRVVIGAPGCARSPKANGFDLVLDRVLAGLAVEPADIVAMGVGGLLEETAARPRPRRGDNAVRPERPAAIVLAAGRSTRMGVANKLLEEVSGKPMVVHVVEAALGSRATRVVVVTGHEAARVEAALADCNVTFVYNGAFADGLSTSLRAGLEALPGETDAALILLGDMPLVTAEDCTRVLGGLEREGALIAMATDGGGRGNPVAWSSRLFPELRATEGDAGGRALMSRYADRVVDVEIGRAAGTDADTPQALAALRKGLDPAG
ncbi:molybdopterin-binding/glycosyltransferase family 2 protein [Acuticoccus sp. MNP-M23]|uniref:molybdopterin-binding/glycosyltransferase family 2 protein n=1 Tax=Acuticoccus sp. MNP-M23 TaxID=3072793 RepID=UPI002816692D|nr:molybdopterin-binding/glycosyltransferase family 2 protein [Acuticoccus sp. MNP-M23]WMS44259.1 molybdopterin-binding/glycosyltransferase family 2 protein [Acuticoccus sp. MNP-M23]